MLHLGSRLVGHLVAAALGCFGDAQLAQHPRQGRVAHRDAFFLGKFFVHTLNAPVALPVQSAQQFLIDVALVLTDGLGHLSALGDDGPDSVAANLEPPGDLPQAHAFLVQQEDRFTLVRFDHGVL